MLLASVLTVALPDAGGLFKIAREAHARRLQVYDGSMETAATAVGVPFCSYYSAGDPDFYLTYTHPDFGAFDCGAWFNEAHGAQVLDPSHADIQAGFLAITGGPTGNFFSLSNLQDMASSCCVGLVATFAGGAGGSDPHDEPYNINNVVNTVPNSELNGWNGWLPNYDWALSFLIKNSDSGTWERYFSFDHVGTNQWFEHSGAGYYLIWNPRAGKTMTLQIPIDHSDPENNYVEFLMSYNAGDYTQDPNSVRTDPDVSLTQDGQGLSIYYRSSETEEGPFGEWTYFVTNAGCTDSWDESDALPDWPDNMELTLGDGRYNGALVRAVPADGYIKNVQLFNGRRTLAEISATANGDPHLTFAHGGTADFRGVDGKHFVMLSAPNVQFSMRTNNATHDLKSMDTEWKWKRVDGSFFTEAAWVVRGLSKKLYGVSTDAATNGAKIFTLDGPVAKEIANPTGAWREWAKDGLRVTVRQISVSVATQGWETTVTKKPVYNSVLGPTQRLDMRMKPCTGGHCGVPSKTCHPHGIVGQSYDGDSTAISGRKDNYKQAGSNMTTTAMAEGAIEGDGMQYALANMFSTEFKYSRFDRSRKDECGFRDVSKLSKLTRAVNAEATDDGFASSEELGDLMEYATSAPVLD